MTPARTIRLAGLMLVLLLALELLLPAFAHAQRADGVGSAVPSYGVLDWLNLGLRLALVIGAIYAAVVAMRWYVRRVNGDGGRLGRQVQVLESRALGPNRSLHLVRLGGRAVLLGVTAERINTLISIDDATEVERLVEAAHTPSTNPLQRVAEGMNAMGGLASMGLARRERRAPVARRASAQPTLLARALEWLNPMPPQRLRPQYRAAEAAAMQQPMPAAAPAAPLAAQRVQAANAYAREATVAAAQRAIVEAQRGMAR